MLQRLRRALALIFLFANIIAADDDISVEIEGLSNFFNPFNWFGEDASASETPERAAPQPQPELVAQPKAAPQPASPSEPENVQETNVSEVRIEGAPRDSVSSMKPVNLVAAAPNPSPNNNVRLSGGASNNSPSPSNFGQPGMRSSYGGPPYGVPAHPSALRHPRYESSAYRSAPYRAPPYGNAPQGNSLYGNAPHGSSLYGNMPQGNSPYGASPYGSPAYGASNIYGNTRTRNAAPQPPNPSYNRAAPPEPTSYRSKSNKKRGKLTLKPRDQLTPPQ